MKGSWVARSVKSNKSMPTCFEPEAGAVPFPGYRLIRLRGRGGFATVWEASTPTGERIALKFMSSQQNSATIKEIRSLQAIQSLMHSNLTEIHQIWSLPGAIVIGMELADASLTDLMMLYMDEFNKPIEIEKLLGYLAQIASALDYLNARRHTYESRLVGYQHADIKPNNILLFGDQAKLADYGMAVATYGTMTPCPRQGTIEYAAPEVFQGYVTEYSDQFSLALTYHLLRTQAFPYPKPPPNGETLRNFVRPEPDLSLLPECERPILRRALAKIPQNRYPNCSSFINALYQVNQPRPASSSILRILERVKHLTTTES